ncbi:MAG: septation regulator SpoVG [Defluviitaleaceae bacterium]|nr:septation regulator SpoVG [Defluviitaleaceae bacterium]
MQITDVRIRKISNENKMRAVVSVTFDDELVVHGIRIVEGDQGFFIAMPSRKTGGGEYKDIAHPISARVRERIQASILEKYESLLYQEEVAATRL